MQTLNPRLWRGFSVSGELVYWKYFAVLECGWNVHAVAYQYAEHEGIDGKGEMMMGMGDKRKTLSFERVLSRDRRGLNSQPPA